MFKMVRIGRCFECGKLAWVNEHGICRDCWVKRG